jgi:hypothetical protein
MEGSWPKDTYDGLSIRNSDGSVFVKALHGQLGHVLFKIQLPAVKMFARARPRKSRVYMSHFVCFVIEYEGGVCY